MKNEAVIKQVYPGQIGGCNSISLCYACVGYGNEGCRATREENSQLVKY